MRFSFLEKLGASLLICAWLIYGSHLIGNALVPVPEAQEVAEAQGGAEPAKEKTAAAPESEADFATLLAAPDAAAAGAKIFNKCKACHSIEQGGPNKVGPHLWSVVGRPKAHVADFAYSDALKGLGGEWTYQDLNTFLTSPKAFAPGTKMTFAGLKKVEDRAAVIAYLRENGDNPPPLPTPEPKAEKAAAAAPPAENAAEEKATEEKAAEAPKEAAAAKPAAEGGGDLAAMLASADPAAGEKIFHKCKACHTAEKGGPNRVGPNLWGIVGRPKASHEGFSYSSALSGLGGDWTYADLNAFLTKPRDYAPGTKMTFAGLKKPEDRADVITYLRTLSDSPKPLP
jgi:cytochrome c